MLNIFNRRFYDFCFFSSDDKFDYFFEFINETI